MSFGSVIFIRFGLVRIFFMHFFRLKTFVQRLKETMRKAKEEESTNLFGSPTFVDIGNGRLRCVETGHEVVAGDEESYARNKRCRLGLIDHALSQGKPPLNLFSQCPFSRLAKVSPSFSSSNQ